MIKQLPDDLKSRSQDVKKEEKGVDPQVILNILSFSRSLKVEKTKMLGKVTHIAN